MSRRHAVSDGWMGGSTPELYEHYIQKAHRTQLRREALGIQTPCCRICGTEMNQGQRICPGCGCDGRDRAKGGVGV